MLACLSISTMYNHNNKYFIAEFGVQFNNMKLTTLRLTELGHRSAVIGLHNKRISAMNTHSNKAFEIA